MGLHIGYKFKCQQNLDFGAYCPIQSMVRESYGCIIGDAPVRAIPFGRVATVSDFLRRCADTAMIGGEMMTTRQRSAKLAARLLVGGSVCQRSFPRQIWTRRASMWGLAAISWRCRPTAPHSRCKSSPPSRRTCIAWLAGGVRSGDRGNGVDRGVLDTAVRGVGRAGV